MTGTPRRVYRSMAFYPVSGVYAVAVALAAAVAGHTLRADVALILLTMVVIAVLLISTRREVGNIHDLVNSQHDELVATIHKMSSRIDQLLAALHAAGVAVPHDDTGVDP